MEIVDAPPPKPTTADEATAWLRWAQSHHHGEGCQCHGCGRARVLASRPKRKVGAKR